VTDDDTRTLKLTFMRAYSLKSTIRPALFPDQPGSQCLFPQEFRYALMPHAGGWNDADVLNETYAFLLPLRAASAGRSVKGTLPRQDSFFTVAPHTLQLSAVKRSENGKMLVVRLWNPTSARIDGTLTCLKKPAEAVRLSPAEERRGKLAIDGRAVKLRLGPKKILTLGLRF
jgi:alpha-mannosidase